jgi:hypothetical protein
MKFMLMMHAPRGNRDYQINAWKPEEFRAHIQFMKDLNKDLREAGELVGAEGLAPPGQARIVRSQGEGAPEVTDGPFAEFKESLVGYWIVDVESAERAYAIAGQASTGPGWKAARHQDRGASGDERAARRDVGSTRPR